MLWNQPSYWISRWYPQPVVPPPTTGCNHPLFPAFSAMFGDRFACQESSVCQALTVAEIYTKGFVSVDRKELAAIYMTAHLLTTGAIAAMADQANLVGMTTGKPPSPLSAAEYETWLARSEWGLAYLNMVNLNARVGFVCV